MSDWFEILYAYLWHCDRLLKIFPAKKSVEKVKKIEKRQNPIKNLKKIQRVVFGAQTFQIKNLIFKEIPDLIS